MVCYDRTIFENLNIETIIFKVVQMKVLAMHNTYQKSFDIFRVGNVQISSWNMIFTYYPNDFCHKRKIYNFDRCNVFLAIAINIPQRLETGFVLQGHIW